MAYAGRIQRCRLEREPATSLVFAIPQIWLATATFKRFRSSDASPSQMSGRKLLMQEQASGPFDWEQQQTIA